MSGIFGVPVDAAYYVVTNLAAALTPLTGGLAVAVAIVVFTVAVRLLLLPFSYYALRGQLAQSRLAARQSRLVQRARRQVHAHPEADQREPETPVGIGLAEQHMTHHERTDQQQPQRDRGREGHDRQHREPDRARERSHLGVEHVEAGEVEIEVILEVRPAVEVVSVEALHG